MTPLLYSGVGRRETPPAVLAQITDLARQLSALGWILRSGGARGADAAWLAGASQAGIFLPDPYHEGYQPREGVRFLREPTDDAREIAKAYHPAWHRLPDSTRRLMARNVHIVLGADCNTRSRFVACFSADGADGTTIPTTQATGGTGHTIRVAAAYGVPVLNLARRRADEILIFAEEAMRC